MQAALQVVVPFGEELAPCNKAARRQTRCGKQLQLQGFSAAHRPRSKQSPRLFVNAVSRHPMSPTEHISAEEWPQQSFEALCGVGVTVCTRISPLEKALSYLLD